MLFGWTNRYLHQFALTHQQAGELLEYVLVTPELDMGDALAETTHFSYLDLDKSNLIYTYDFDEAYNTSDLNEFIAGFSDD